MKLAVLDDYQRAVRTVADWSLLDDRVDLTVFHDRVADVDGLVERLEPSELVMPLRERTPITRGLLERLGNLQLLVNAGMRAPGIDVPAATDHGILVCGTPTEGEGPTQHTWALLLALVRHVAAEDAGMRRGSWGKTLGTDLTGKTLGLLGLGTIGSQMARIGLAFGMRVVAWSHNLTLERAAALGAELVGKDQLFRDADVVSLHLRLSDRTLNVVGARELGLMKATAVLVNTARGALVDERALVEALARGGIAGAALDVFASEPLPPGHPLLDLPNTLLTPHIGYVTDARYHGYYEGAIRCVNAFLAGSPVGVINPEVLDSPVLRAEFS